MIGTSNFWLFVTAGVVLNVTPGPDTLYILGRSVSQGRRTGVLSVLGISSGILIHTAAAAVGLSALLASSASVFAIIRLAGAAYLIYLGLRLLLKKDRRDVRVTADATPSHSWVVYRQGLLTNVLNPKVALFFLAFLPQFVDPQTSHHMLAFLLLGLTFVFTGTLWGLLLAWSAASASQFLRARPASNRWINRASGAVFIGLGLRVARG